MKTFYHVGQGVWGKGLAIPCLSGLVFMTSIVILTAGGGTEGLHYEATVWALFSNYTRLLRQQATRQGALWEYWKWRPCCLGR